MNIKQLVILHGWGLNSKNYSSLKKYLEGKKIRVYIPDLPGFGKNKLKKDLMLSDYADFLKEYIFQNNIKDAALIGHSFGGRVIVKYLSLYKNTGIKGVVLSGTPLVRNLSLKKIIARKISKTVKSATNKLPKRKITENAEFISRKFLYKMIGEYDYLKAGPMKNTFLNIINENLEKRLPNIKVPTLIIWGSKDKTTPLSIGKKMKKQIHNSTLLVIDGTHKIPYERPKEFSDKVIKFISSI